MMNSMDFTSKLAVDSKSIDDLQLLSQKDSKKALQEAAKQFEALFLHMLVKSMRDATLKSGLMDSQQTQFYTEMYDQQLSQTLASKGIGLADMMVEQLTRAYDSPELMASISKSVANETATKPTSNASTPDIVTELPMAARLAQSMQSTRDDKSVSIPTADTQNTITSSTTGADVSRRLWSNEADNQTFIAEKADVTGAENNVTASEKTGDKLSFAVFNTAADFIHKLMPHANIASESTGIPAHFMLAQAALESGWGKHEIRHPDNSPSFNLFGIKAGRNWQGDTVDTVTTEYINGVPHKTVEKFRAYDSYEEGFRDYANLLSNNPRYEKVVNTQNPAEFAYGLQRAGYATDPQYGNKLMRILNNPVLHNQDVI